MKVKSEDFFEEKEPRSIMEFLDEIQDWYDHNKYNFKTKFKLTIDSILIPDQDEKEKLPEEGTDHIKDWSNAGIESLKLFFKEWYDWMPNPEDDFDELKWIIRFSWLYYKNSAGQSFVQKGIGHLMTIHFVKLRADRIESNEEYTKLIRKFEIRGKKGVYKNKFKKYIEDYQKDPREFKNFNEFFAREIRPETRPTMTPDYICKNEYDSVVIAPTDCIINMISTKISLDTLIQTKTENISFYRLFNDSKYVENFLGGTAVSCILLPNTYHRYHSPVSGTIVESRENVAGAYFGIDDFPNIINYGNIGSGYNYCIFENFRRGYFIIKTEEFGYVGMVAVGLNTIGSVKFNEEFKNIGNDSQYKGVKKGTDLGCFKFGGSLVILVFEKGRFDSISLLMGQRIGVLKKQR